jgi:hypothetical protein
MRLQYVTIVLSLVGLVERSEAQVAISSVCFSSGGSFSGTTSLVIGQPLTGTAAAPGGTPSARLGFLYVTPAIACRADLNNDGAVDTLDLTRFLGRFGSSQPPGTGGDFNGDGIVTTPDLVFFLGRFGSTC